MKITVKTFGSLKNNLGGQDEAVLEFKETVSVEDILKKLQLSPEDITMITIGGKTRSLDYLPQNGDELILIPIIGGG